MREHLGSLDMSEPTAQDRIRRIEAEVAQAHERAELMEGLQGAISSLTASGRSRAGQVEVEVDSAGRLTAIEFAPGFERLAPGALAGAVMEAVTAARRAAGRAVVTLTEDTFGKGSLLTEQLTQAWQDTSGVAEEDDEPPLPPPSGPIIRPR